MSEDYIAKSPGSLLGVSDVKMEFVNGLMVKGFFCFVFFINPSVYAASTVAHGSTQFSV